MNSACTALSSFKASKTSEGLRDSMDETPERLQKGLEHPENHLRSPLRGTASFGEERRFPTATTGKNANNA